MLLYHRVTSNAAYRGRAWRDKAAFLPNLGLFVDSEEFARQMELLRDEFEILHPLDVVRRPQQLFRNLGRRKVLVSFDDGYRDNFECALPILERFNVPAIFFITTGFIDHIAYPWWFELERWIGSASHLDPDGQILLEPLPVETVAQKYEAWDRLYPVLRSAPQTLIQGFLQTRGFLEQQRELSRSLFPSWRALRESSSNPLVTFGAHSVSHSAFAHESAHFVAEECRASHEALARKAGVSAKVFAYPFGDSSVIDEQAIEVLQEVGLYSLAFTTEERPIGRQDVRRRFQIPRVHVDYFDSLVGFRNKLTGRDTILSYLRP